MPVAIRNQQRLHKVATPRLKKLAQRALDLLNAGNDNLSLVLVDNAGIQQLNRQFHATDAPTDVLAFDYGDGDGEVIVSVERAVAVAKRYRNTPSRELALYVVHGILHLHGHNDLTPAARRQMRQAESRLITALGRDAGSLFVRD
jgi:probable rRNA maturation factor